MDDLKAKANYRVIIQVKNTEDLESYHYSNYFNLRIEINE